jgi:hypothetical protein
MIMETELMRINGPRVDKIVAALEVIEKSCKSQRAHELDVARLLAPVAEKLDSMLDPDAVHAISLKPGPVIVQQDWQHKERKIPTLDLQLHAARATLEAMSVKQLTDLLTMTAAQIDIKLNP